MDLNPENKKNVGTIKSRIFTKGFIHMIRHRKTMDATMGQDREKEELLQNIQYAKQEWVDATQHFEYVEEDGLIDYHTYQIMACQARYEYFLKKAKESGIKIYSC